MKQSLFANCYSTIHELNLLKHTYTHTHTHTHTVQELLRLHEVPKVLILVFQEFFKFNLRKSQAENFPIFSFKY